MNSLYPRLISLVLIPALLADSAFAVPFSTAVSSTTPNLQSQFESQAINAVLEFVGVTKIDRTTTGRDHNRMIAEARAAHPSFAPLMGYPLDGVRGHSGLVAERPSQRTGFVTEEPSREQERSVPVILLPQLPSVPDHQADLTFPGLASNFQKSQEILDITKKSIRNQFKKIGGYPDFIQNPLEAAIDKALSLNEQEVFQTFSSLIRTPDPGRDPQQVETLTGTIELYTQLNVPFQEWSVDRYKKKWEAAKDNPEQQKQISDLYERWATKMILFNLMTWLKPLDETRKGLAFEWFTQYDNAESHHPPLLARVGQATPFLGGVVHPWLPDWTLTAAIIGLTTYILGKFLVNNRAVIIKHAERFRQSA